MTGNGKDGGGSKGRGPGIQDLLLWKAFTKDVDPLKDDPDWAALEEEAKEVAAKEKPNSKERAVLSHKKQPERKPSPDQPAQLDRRTEEKFRKGKMLIEARLDLHGYTQDEAHAALVKFIQGAHSAGKRCVLVITGKGTPRSRAEEEEMRGSGTRRGILKARVPDWLSAPPLGNIVLKTASARPKDGGDGAFYVYLKRLR